MTAQDIETQVKAWVSSEVTKQAFGETFGYAVTFGVAAVQTPAGPAQIPMWTLLLTTHNPLLNEGPLYHGPVAIGSPRPSEKDVRAEVAKGMGLLRGLAKTKLAGANGHAQART